MRIYADLHSDILTRSFDEKKDITDKSLMFNISDVQGALPYIQLCAIFINSKYEISKYNYGNDRANKIISWYKEEYLKFKDSYNLHQIINKEDIEFVEKNKKVGIILTVENMSAIGDNLNNLDSLINCGIKIASLTWNGTNLIASGTFSKSDTGISKFGKKVLNKINEHNMILDVSHLSDNSFLDVIDYGYNNIMATHSCARGLCCNERNLTDEQIKYIAKSEGVIGICLYNEFLNCKTKIVKIDDVIDHIVYISNLTSVDNVCIGSDFDGLERKDLPLGISGVRDIHKIEERMIERKFSKNEVEKIFGRNFKNFLSKKM